MTSSPAPDLEPRTEAGLCGFPSSVSGRLCMLPVGHPADTSERFHRFALGAAGWLRNELTVLPMSGRRREALFALLDAALAEAVAPTPLAPPAGISPVETAGHSSPAPDLDELERLAKASDCYESDDDIRDCLGKFMAGYSFLLTELRAAREAAAPTPLAPPAGTSPVETAGHSSSDLDELPCDHHGDGPCPVHGSFPWNLGCPVVAVRAAREATAESGRLREALREKVEALPFRFNNARDAALLATPPAPSDHGALDVERLARALVATDDDAQDLLDEEAGETLGASFYEDAMPRARLIAAEYARLAAPSVSPEPPTMTAQRPDPSATLEEQGLTPGGEAARLAIPQDLDGRLADYAADYRDLVAQGGLLAVPPEETRP